MEGCVRVFQRVSALEKHLSLDKCTRRPEKLSVMDLAKLGYRHHLEEGAGVLPTITPTSGAKEAATLKEGWALKASRKSYRFNKTQKIYLNAKFRIGQTTGRKVNAETVAREMRRARDSDGKRLFSITEFLSSQQIASYFSRLSAANRNQDVEEADIEAVQEEINFTDIRDSVLDSDVEEHPIVFDQFDLCAMYASNKLKDLKVAMLQYICEQLDLDVPQRPVRRKQPYLTLLEDMIRRCSCSRDEADS